MRIAIGGIMHESNTFASEPTDLAAFGARHDLGDEGDDRRDAPSVQGIEDRICAAPSVSAVTGITRIERRDGAFGRARADACRRRPDALA